jgi:ABC-type multidrug transport system ATPase subunit
MMSIVVSDLCKSFGERKVLDKISFDIGKQNFTLLGPNGAGKTTLVNIICGLLPYDSGKVSVCVLIPARRRKRSENGSVGDTGYFDLRLSDRKGEP